MNKEIKINIPTSFQKLKTLPEDPINSISYGKQTQSSNCFIIMFPINKQSSMPYENKKIVIDGIHNALEINQGLIEVNFGITKKQNKYIYSIVKSKLEPSGMQYALTMHIDAKEYCINIQAFFDEIGTTGFRDTIIMNELINKGKLTPTNMDEWAKDPYDENFKKGIPMNLSEKQEYDAKYPQHALSETRALVKYIIENN